MTWLSVLLLHIRNIGPRGIELGPEQIELQRLVFSLGLGVGSKIGVGITSGRNLRFKQVLDFVHRLPWLRSLLSCGRVGGLRLEPS
jgi:hypothetical protein